MTIPPVRSLALVAVTAAALAIPATAASAAVDSPDLIAPTPGTTQINLVGFNDFHGRLLDAERFGATVLQAQQGFGDENSLVLSNGDAVSASIFESAIQLDAPTIDALNALGVDSFTVGNHEFDHGADDATGRIQDATAGPDLAANVVAEDGSLPFDAYALFTVGDVTVGVIGAVTAETPALSAANAVGSYTFTDPVDAVNRVAAQLTDGDDGNGEADILVASYHEGAPASDVPLEENTTSAVFDRIVNDTDPAVSAIFTAHTHQTYAYDAPNGDSTRPVVQAGSYGSYIGQIVLTLDEDGAVVASDSSVVPTLAADAIPADIAADPRIAEIRDIVADAVAEADVLGLEEVGTMNADITRAKIFSSVVADPTTGVTTGVVEVAEDRANASNLSDLIAQSLVDVVNARGTVSADLALMNPGGVRADLLNDDGVITYKEAATIVPFANDISVVTLTTEQLRETLEQQWQTNADGSIPARPYLQLGLSDAFTYSYDASLPAGERITGMSLDGEPLAAGRELNVAMSSFLAGGGDNFRALLGASAVVSTGMIDTDELPNWFRMVSGDTGEDVVADVHRQGFEVQGVRSGSTLTCEETTLAVAGFDLANLGYVQNSSVEATIVTDDASTTIGAADVAEANSAELAVTVPAGAEGDALLLITAQPSGSTVTLPVTLACPETPAVVVTPSPSDTASASPSGSSDADDVVVEETADAGELAVTGANGGAALIIGVAAVLIVGAGVVVVLVSRRRSRH